MITFNTDQHSFQSTTFTALYKMILQLSRYNDILITVGSIFQFVSFPQRASLQSSFLQRLVIITKEKKGAICGIGIATISICVLFTVNYIFSSLGLSWVCRRLAFVLLKLIVFSVKQQRQGLGLVALVLYCIAPDQKCPTQVHK